MRWNPLATGGITLLVIAFAWLWHTTVSPSTRELLVLDRAMTSAWPPSSSSEQPIEETLPDSWNPKSREGGRRYLLTFERSSTSNADWGIYIPRIGNRFHVSMNGQLLAPYGPLAPSNIDYAQQPHLVLIPAQAIHAGTNEIEILVYGERARYAGLSRVHLGPIHAARNAFYSRETLQTRGSFAVISLSLLFGLISTPIALRLRDRATTLFAAACWLSALRSSYFLVAQPPLPYTWWSFVTDSAYLAYLVCLAEFCIEIIGTRRKLTRAATTAIFLFTLVLLPLHAFGRLHWARQAWLAGVMIYSFFIRTYAS
jgi:hypothetical protein